MRTYFLIALLLFGHIAFAQDSNYQALLLDNHLTNNANAVVRYDEMIVELSSQRQLNLKRRRAITVLNEIGNVYATAYVGYDSSRKVKNIEAVVYDASGKRLEKIRDRDFHDISAVDGGTLYSDARYKYYSYTPIQYPYTIEVAYEVSTKNTGEMPASWTFLEGFMVSTEKSRLQINYASPELKPKLKEKNLEDLEIAKKETDGSIVYEAINIPAIKDESLAPSFGQLAPKIMIRPINFHYEGFDAKINDWNDLGRWMNENLLKGRDELPPATQSMAKALVTGVEDDLEKAKIIYKYVQENTRYISVQVGIGGIQPISALEVDRVKYGDCKGLSNYTKALLNTVGVEAYYAHIEAGNEKIDFDEGFPDLAQGNHVVLAIPHDGDYYWIDCTSQVHPFGFIGDFTDDRKAFIIKPDGGEIVTTQAYINEENYQLMKGTYAINEDGGITGEVVINTKGIQYDSHFKLEERPEDDIEKHYKSYWDNINNLNVKSFQFQNDKQSVQFTEHLLVDAANYASKSGKRLLFAPNAFNKNKFVPNRYRSRKLPFEVQRGFLDEDKFAIEIPASYVVEAVPEAISIENKFGVYNLSFERSEDQIVLKRKLFIKQGEYSNTEYEAFRNFLKNVVKHDGSKIVIKSIL